MTEQRESLSLRQRASKAAAEIMERDREQREEDERQQRECALRSLKSALLEVLKVEVSDDAIHVDVIGLPCYDEDGFRFYNDSARYLNRLTVHAICEKCGRAGESNVSIYHLSDLAKYADHDRLCEVCAVEASRE